MSILRTHNLQNPDSSSINIVMDQGGNTNITGVTTVGGSNFHVPSGSVGIGTDNPGAKLEVHSDAIPRINSIWQKSKHIGMSVGGSGGGFVVTDGHFLAINHQPYSDRGTDNNLTERLRITSDGRIGIGMVPHTSSTGYALQIDGGASSFIQIFNDTSGNTLNDGLVIGNDANTAYFVNKENTPLAFRTNNAERLRITSGGDVLVGGHSAYTYDDTGASNVILDIYGGATAGKRGILSLSGRVGDNNGDIGTIWFNNDNNSGTGPGNQMKLSAAIQAKISTSDGNTGSDAGAYLQFMTKPEGGSVAERLRINTDGSIYVGGSLVTEDDMNWGHDTYQRPHIFAGQSGGNPADGVVVVASAETNPGATRIGSLVYGCKTSGSSGVANSGLKAYIDCHTNTNVSDAWKTGAYINFATRADNGNLNLAQRISSDGEVTKPKQPGFYARRTTSGDGRSGGQGITEWHISGTGSYNEGGHFKTSGADQGKFVAPVTGKYFFSAAPGYKQTGHNFNVYFRINGTNVSEPVRFIDGGDDLASHSLAAGSIIIHMTAGQKFDVYIGYTHHVNVTLNFFCGYLIG